MLYPPPRLPLRPSSALPCPTLAQDTGGRDEVQLWVDEAGYPGQLLWAPTAAWHYDPSSGPDPDEDEAAALAIESAVMDQARALSWIDVTSLADGAWTDTFQRGDAAAAVPNCCLSFILQNESLVS